MLGTTGARAISEVGAGVEIQEVGAWDPLFSEKAPEGALANLSLPELINGSFDTDYNKFVTLLLFETFFKWAG